MKITSIVLSSASLAALLVGLVAHAGQKVFDITVKPGFDVQACADSVGALDGAKVIQVIVSARAFSAELTDASAAQASSLPCVKSVDNEDSLSPFAP